MFLGPDEHLIVMNLPPGIPTQFGPSSSMTEEELTKLRDVGVRVIFNYDFWRTSAADNYAYLDETVQLHQRLGMRSLITSYQDPPQDLPDAYYCKHQDGSPGCSENGKKTLSIFNIDARAALLDHYDELIARYGGPDVLVIHSGADSGEIVLPHKPAFYDTAALISHQLEVGGVPNIATVRTQTWLRRGVLEHFLTIDELLITQHNEIWQALHPWLDWARKPRGANGNFAQEDILKVEADLWPTAARTLLQYTYFHHYKPVRNNVPYKKLIAMWQQQYNLRIVVEADYCKGLETTTPESVSKGFVGQLVGVVHPWAGGRDRMEQWQLDAVAKSVRRWDER